MRFAAIILATLLVPLSFADDRPAATSMPATAPLIPPVVVSQLLVENPDLAGLYVPLQLPRGGTQFALVLYQPDHEILGIDAKASTLVSATDDRGTNLVGDHPGGWPWIGTRERIKWMKGYGSDVAIPFSLSRPPAPGATFIHFKANLVLRAGGNEKTGDISPFELAKGLDTKFAGHNLKVALDPALPFTNMEDTATTLQLNLSTNELTYWLKSADLIDDKGAVIKSDNAAWSSNSVTRTKIITFDRSLKYAGLRITYYEMLEGVNVPIDLKISIGIK